MIWLLKDVHNFLQQFIPSPFLQYRFSPADLARFSPKRRLASSSSDADSILHTFDVLSYNINNAASSSPDKVRKILRAIFSSGASIILLQETNPTWEKLLHEDAVALQYNCRFFHHPGKEDRSAGGIAILSQYYLEDISVLDLTKDVSGSVFPALIFKAVVSLSDFDNSQQLSSHFPELIDGESIRIGIANVHLRPPVELDGYAWLNTARKTEPIRLGEVKGLVRRTTTHDRSLVASTHRSELDIIAGDFNEGDFGAALTYLSTTLSYTDALQQFVPRRKETHQWPFMKNLWTLRKRLDHIFWRSDPLSVTTKIRNTECVLRLKCLGCGVLTGYETGASDHQPVLARFGVVVD